MKDLSNGQKPKDFKKHFILEMAKLGELFDYTMGIKKIELYYEILSKEMELDAFLWCCKKLQKEFKPGYGVKFPMPSDFMRKLDESKIPPNVQFDIYYDELQHGVTRGKIKGIGDDIFIQIVKDNGGLFNLSRWTYDDWKFNRSRLKDSYVSKCTVIEKRKEHYLTGPDALKLLNVNVKQIGRTE